MIDIEAIRASHPLPAVVGATVKLTQAGREWKACCPLHNDRSPSFTIFDGGTRFHCFGCDAGGDVLDYVRQLHKVDLLEAAAMLTGDQLPVVVHRPAPPEPERDTSGEARTIWRSAAPIADTPAAAYLHGRGIYTRLPESLRFARLKYPGRSGLLPCMVAVVANAENKLSGIQRTFVREDGSGKADVPNAKLSLGRIRGGAVRLAPGATELTVCGGIEDGLTLQQELARAVWCVTGEGNMASLVLPPGVRDVTIGADNDASGREHARRAAEAFTREGRTARLLRPLPGFKDFNSELQGIAA